MRKHSSVRKAYHVGVSENYVKVKINGLGQNVQCDLTKSLNIFNP
jgi:hypothetical protein